MTTDDIKLAAKKAYLIFDQLKNMRRNVRHITSLDGIKHFITMANNKAEDLTIKKLTWGNPTMKAKFDELSDKKE